MPDLMNMTDDEFLEYFHSLPHATGSQFYEKDHIFTQRMLLKEYQALSPEALKRQRTAYKKAMAKAIKEKLVTYTDMDEDFWSAESPEDEAFLYQFELQNTLRVARITAKALKKVEGAR